MSVPATRFHVATNGDDQWSGLLDAPNADGTDGPFATLVRGRDAVRQLKLSNGGGLTGPVEILVRAGTYHMDQPLRLSGGDSGTDRFPVTYMACPGEKPIISGGRPITNWQPYRDKIVCASLPETRKGHWWFRQLFYKGTRMIRARYPRYDPANPRYGGWAFVDTPVSEQFDPDTISKTDLSSHWQFRIDPENVGMDEQWFAQDRADDDWDTLQTNRHWDNQGYKDYHGSAWYRTRFAMPEDFDTRKHLWMLFGAADKEAFVYIDGTKVFERTKESTGIDDVNRLWNIPFKFDVRRWLKPGHEHVIAVRVRSNQWLGGIWRTVSLVSADSEMSPEILIGKVDAPVAFRYEPDAFPNKWAKPEQAEIFIIPGRGWISDIIPIKKVNDERHTIHLTRPVGPSRNNLGLATHIESGNRFYVENNIEDLAGPGQWCLDTDTGTVYFWPPDGDVGPAEVTAPATARLIQMIGTRRSPVSHVTFKGFTFTQTQAQWPTPESYYKTPNAGQTVYMEDTQDCVIEDNFFDAVGGDAVRLQDNNARNRIVGNHIADAGAYGIFVGGFRRGLCASDPISGDIPGPSPWHDNHENQDDVVGQWPRSGGHLISNNHIHDIGYFEKHANGIAFFGVSASDVVVSHNLIHHTPRFGIGMMSGFGRIIIEYNHLHHLSLETCDTGGITANRWYTYDHDPDLCRGNIIRFNCVHDVVGCGAYEVKMETGGNDEAEGRIWTSYYGWAIYFDNGAMDVHVYGNITARNPLGGIMIAHYGQNVAIENNIFVDSDKSQAYLMFAGKMSNVRFRNNIFSYSDPDAGYMRMNLGPGINLPSVITQYDHNVYSPPKGVPMTFSGLPGEAAVRTEMQTQDTDGTTMDSWKALGFDSNSIIADPRFVDPDNDDYNLQPDSPAFKLGFKAIDTSRIGLLPKR